MVDLELILEDCGQTLSIFNALVEFKSFLYFMSHQLARDRHWYLAIILIPVYLQVEVQFHLPITTRLAALLKIFG